GGPQTSAYPGAAAPRQRRAGNGPQHQPGRHRVADRRSAGGRLALRADPHRRLALLYERAVRRGRLVQGQPRRPRGARPLPGAAALAGSPLRGLAQLAALGDPPDKELNPPPPDLNAAGARMRLRLFFLIRTAGFTGAAGPVSPSRPS